jgi:hypothetical protein
MGWLYKFLLQVIEDKCCYKCGCSTCGSSEFRATLISKLKCYRIIPEIDKLSKFNDRNYFIAPIYRDLDAKTQLKIVEEISKELSKLKQAQITRLEEISDNYMDPILRCLFYEFSNQSDYLYSLLVGTPAGIYLKKMIDHFNSRRI